MVKNKNYKTKQINIDTYFRVKNHKVEKVKAHDKNVHVKPQLSKKDLDKIKKGKARDLVKNEKGIFPAYKKLTMQTPRSKKNMTVELYNCDEEYLKTVKKVMAIHPANHSVSMFLQMKDEADLAMYCHPLLAKDSTRDFVLSYIQKYKYPFVMITRDENIEKLFEENGVPTKWRRWCTRVFKIEPTRLFYKTFIPSGVIEMQGIQKEQSKERGEMNPNRIEDPKSQKRYKIYRELPVFYETEEENMEEMKKAKIKPIKDSVRSFNRYGCFLCPFAGQQYYKDLKKNDLKTYENCQKLMKCGSKKTQKQYYYYRKSKIM